VVSRVFVPDLALKDLSIPGGLARTRVELGEWMPGRPEARGSSRGYREGILDLSDLRRRAALSGDRAPGRELRGETVHQPEDVFQSEPRDVLGTAVHAYDVGIFVGSILGPEDGAVAVIRHGPAGKNDGRRRVVRNGGKLFRIYRNHLHLLA
jgi:hypothetical protein